MRCCFFPSNSQYTLLGFLYLNILSLPETHPDRDPSDTRVLHHGRLCKGGVFRVRLVPLHQRHHRQLPTEVLLGLPCPVVRGGILMQISEYWMHQPEVAMVSSVNTTRITGRTCLLSDLYYEKHLFKNSNTDNLVHVIKKKTSYNTIPVWFFREINAI